MGCPEKQPLDLSIYSFNSENIENVPNSDLVELPFITYTTPRQKSTIGSTYTESDIKKLKYFCKNMTEENSCSLRIPESKIPSSKIIPRTEYGDREPSFLVSNSLNANEAKNPGLEQTSQVYNKHTPNVSKSSNKMQVFECLALKKVQSHPLFMFPKEKIIETWEQYQLVEKVCDATYNQLNSATSSYRQPAKPNSEESHKASVKLPTTIENDTHLSENLLSRFVLLYCENSEVYTCLVCSSFSSLLAEEMMSHGTRDRVAENTNEEWIVNDGTCMLCSLYSHKSVGVHHFKKHLQGKRHLQLLNHYNHIKEGNKREGQIMNVRLVPFYYVKCNPCEFVAASLQQFKKHVKSNGHIGRTRYYLNLLQNKDFEAVKSYLSTFKDLSSVQMEALQNAYQKMHPNLAESREKVNLSMGDKISMSADASSNSAKVNSNADHLKSNLRTPTPLLDQIMIGRKTQQNQAIFTCPFCDFHQSSKLAVRVHVLEHSKLLSAFDCSFCLLGFNEKDSLKCHMARFHQHYPLELRMDNPRESETMNSNNVQENTDKSNDNLEMSEIPLEFIFHNVSKLKTAIKQLSFGDAVLEVKEFSNCTISNTQQKLDESSLIKESSKSKRYSAEVSLKCKKPRKSICNYTKEYDIQKRKPNCERGYIYPRWSNCIAGPDFESPNHTEDKGVPYFSPVPAMQYFSCCHSLLPQFTNSQTAVNNCRTGVAMYQQHP